MKKKLFLLPLLALVLGACAPDGEAPTNTQSVPGDQTTQTTEQGGGGQTSTTEQGGGEIDSNVTGITITPASAKIKLGASKKFEATLQPSGATGTVTWEIVELKQSKAKDEEPRVTVNAEGLVEVKKFAKVGTGNYQVKATCGNVSQTADIEIEDFNYGSLEAPISTKDALNIIDWHPYESNGPEAYIKAYVTSNTKANEDGEINANIAYLDDGEAIYMRKATVKEGVTAGVKANDLTGKEIVIKSKVRLETNTQKKEFHYGEIQSVATPVGTETPTKLVVSTNKANVTSAEPLTINSYMLPMPAKGEIVWSVTPETAGLSVENGLVKVTEAVAEGLQVTVTATIKDTQIKQDIAVTVIKAINYGSVDDPLTISEADAIIPSEGKTTQPLFVKGIITEINQSGSSATYNGYLTTDTEREFRFKKLALDNNNAEEMKAKYVQREVIITGIGEVIDALPGMNNPTVAKLFPPKAATTFEIANATTSLKPGESVSLDYTFPQGTAGEVVLTTTSEEIAIEGNKITVKETATTAGEVEITATLKDSNPAVIKTYTLTVIIPRPGEKTATFDTTKLAAKKPMGTYQFGGEGTDITLTGTAEAKANESIYVLTGNNLVLEAVAGYEISEIKLNVTYKKDFPKFTVANGTCTLTGTSSDALFTIRMSVANNKITLNHSSKACNILGITVIYAPIVA